MLKCRRVVNSPLTLPLDQLPKAEPPLFLRLNLYLVSSCVSNLLYVMSPTIDPTVKGLGPSEKFDGSDLRILIVHARSAQLVFHLFSAL